MFQLVLLRITETYFRHRWLYLLPIALMTVVGLIYPITVSSTYMTSGTIYVQDETLLATLNAVQNDGFGWVTPAKKKKKNKSIARKQKRKRNQRRRRLRKKK